MGRMSIRPAVILAAVLLAAGALAGCRQPPAGLVAESMNATLTVLPDGSLEVEEQWSVRSDDGGVAHFRRYTPVSRHDGVAGIEGALDGRPSQIGTAPADLSVGKGPALDAEWTFTSQAGARHTCVLRYRLKGAVAVSGIRGEVSTRLVAPREFAIEAATIALKLPAGAVLLEEPWVEEPGWDVERRPDGLIATRRNIGPDESVTPGATFTIDTMVAGEPSWQYFERRSGDLLPAFVSGGLFLLVIGAGVIGMVRMKYRPWPIRPLDGEPSGLAPDLERALLANRYTAQELPRLVSAGLIDAERMQVARDLRRAAIATLVFGAASLIFTSVTFAHLGPWPLAIPIGILVSGLMFAVEGRRFSILSQAGADARQRMLYSARIRGGPTTA